MHVACFRNKQVNHPNEEQCDQVNAAKDGLDNIHMYCLSKHDTELMTNILSISILSVFSGNK